MNTSQTLAPGTLLYNGDYRIVRILGRGGFGITYLAENVNLEKRVAIKEFFPQGMYNRDGVSGYASVGSIDNNEIVDKLKKKFLKEARRLAGLRDDSIVAVSNAFEENGTAYYVMDFIEGRDLQTIVREEGPMAVDRALRYVRQVGDALDYLHDRRINHLDVKPANILVDPLKDRAVLIDFGLSKQYDENDHQTSTTPVGVSRGYAPFEQYKAGGVKEFSAPTDVYSLGATLYYLLTGERPPEANELVEDPLVIPSSVPDWLRPVILKAMAYRRADRYQSVDTFLKDLQIQDNTDILDDVKQVKVEVNNKRNKRWLPVLIIILFAAFAIGGWFLYQKLSKDDTKPTAENKTEVITQEKNDDTQGNIDLKEVVANPGNGLNADVIEEEEPSEEYELAEYEEEPEEILVPAILDYEGKIGPYSINMSLEKVTNTGISLVLAGAYYYTRYSSDNKMYLRGYAYSDGRVTLDEYNSKNENCGHFYLKEQSDGSLIGKFDSYVSKKQFDVTLYPQ